MSLETEMHIDGIPVPPGLFDVVAVTVIGPTSLRVTFDDGLTGEIDMDTYLTWSGVFAPLKADPALFAQAHVHPDFGTVSWPNEIDIDSEALHARMLWELTQGK